jgi:uncharacterized membrane protein YvbJ
MFCQKCGKENLDTNEFCGTCGEPLKMPATQPNKKEQTMSQNKEIAEIDQKIAEQKKIIDETEGNGWVIILGTIGVLTLIIVIGIIILIIAIAWGWDRHSRNTRAREELRHLETLKEMHK